ncbi:hypothetical protein H2201_007664 [Coniosporium apollinis]|uniref:RING-type E3 ubiquitin transferase n=1 Tax=Coniosporium apollinis TaxID=61459 RepID=A0ABQ9NM13_9PEZI|nr:hypothetical protein H2201_007664 [Coniosporium apollinis]
MRPLRLLLSLCSCVVAISLLLYTTLPSRSHQVAPNVLSQKRSRLHALFSFHTPSSLFPPSAIISLTDDNSTFFLARSAAFGPLLPSKGLSGQLWIGSGFADDSVGRGGVGARSEGELGCSDVPGWEGGGRKPAGSIESDGSSRKSANGSPLRFEAAKDKAGKSKRGVTPRNAVEAVDTTDAASQPADGTDDYLHEPLPASDKLKSAPHGSVTEAGKTPEHADIQSLQESAEITGRIVLLSRGGCGFLEKVKWAQRRGGVAVIVGDDIRGGPLVTMYAKGDTSNITIPALFTSHTTAHLLSSLIPSGGYVEDISVEDALRLGLKVPKGSKNKVSGSGKQINQDRPTFTRTVAFSQQTKTAKSAVKQPTSKGEGGKDTDVETPQSNGWFRWIFGWGSSAKATGRDDRRPPSSGHIDWVLIEDWNEDENIKLNSKPKQPQNAKQKPTATSSRPSADDFVIGVQDWRDKDLLPRQTVAVQERAPSDRSTDAVSTNGHLKGGNALPASGEYEKPGNNAGGAATKPKPSHKDASAKGDEHKSAEKNDGWLSNLLGSNNADPPKPASTRLSQKPSTASRQHQSADTSTNPSIPHEGLWVTLTPTAMSASPFFDTILVLVVSPLVTLTVVYALLLLRSRIRRRRWRAPKSVVERLPVRTYHTIPSDATSPTTPLASPPSPGPMTPLLGSNRPMLASRPSRSRPRSRTASEVPPQTSASSLRSGTRHEHQSHDSTNSEEKREAGLAEWRRRYGGRQKECVVCLEEYVDGVSRVMSLPCGHEFHAECITPWLTTRRRTCPICKGDVVRSLARGSGSPSRPSYRDNFGSGINDGGEEDVQEEAALARNDSVMANRPVSLSRAASEDEALYEDVERGDEDADEDSTERESGDEGRWAEFSAAISRSLGSLSLRMPGRRRPPQELPDRDR